MAIAAFLARHPDLDEVDFRAIQAIISTWFKDRYKSEPEFLPWEDYFTVNEDMEIGEKNEL